jgi:hypothetical protein
LLKNGALNNENDYADDLASNLIFPSNDIIFKVKRILYLPGNGLTVSDIVRGKRLPNTDVKTISELFYFIQEAGFGTVVEGESTSNRNKGHVILIPNKFDSQRINSTSIGRARLKLFRLDVFHLDQTLN